MCNQEIKIRPFELSDIPALATLANNKNVWDNLRDGMPSPYSEKDAENFINLVKNEDPIHTFAIVYKEAVCGVIGLVLQKDVYRKSAEIGYWLGEPYWGKGIITKAVALITAYGFDQLNLIRIYAGVFEFNVASMKVLEKNGYVREGIFKNAIFKNGKICNEHRYYKLNQE